MSNVERLYEPEDLENEVLNWLGGEDPSTSEYTTAVGNLERLHKLVKDSDLKEKLMPSSETIANGVVYLLGLMGPQLRADTRSCLKGIFDAEVP